MKKIIISSHHGGVLEKFSISNNHASLIEALYEYNNFRINLFDILFESFDGMLIRLVSFDSSQGF